MKNLFTKFAKDESGATAIEYGLIAVGISLAVYAGAKAMGTNLSGLFEKMGTQFKGINPKL